MTKFFQFLLTVKSLAALVFSGLVVAYMALSVLFIAVTRESYPYTVPYIILIEALVFSLLAASLWAVLLSDLWPHKVRVAPRLIVFAFGMLALFAACFSVFVVIPTDWSRLWWVVIFGFAFLLIVLAVVGEIYTRRTGRRYTELLAAYNGPQLMAGAALPLKSKRGVKFLRFLAALKSVAALAFTGLLCAYMAVSWLYVARTQDPTFHYNVPYIFLLEAIVISLIIGLLWELLLTEDFIKNWRYFPRLVLFGLAMLAVLLLSILPFGRFHTDWAKLWWLVLILFTGGLIGLSILGEIIYRIKGKRYTELLEKYKENR